MRLLGQKHVIVFSAYLAVTSTDAFAQNQSDIADAAIRLRQAHVIRYYESCVSQNRSDAKCRAELEALHARELAALQKISKTASDYNEFEVSKASAACYSPTHDYKDLIECWEQLAAEMAAGEDIKPDASKTVASIPERAAEIFLELTPIEKRSIILCVRGKVSINYRDTVARNLQIGGSDALWALKISGFESVQMSSLAEAASWTKMASYYKTEAANVKKLIRGEIDIDKYRLISKENEGLLTAALTPEMSRQSEHGRNFKKFADVCEELATKVIGRAKASASE